MAVVRADLIEEALDLYAKATGTNENKLMAAVGRIIVDESAREIAQRAYNKAMKHHPSSRYAREERITICLTAALSAAWDYKSQRESQISILEKEVESAKRNAHEVVPVPVELARSPRAGYTRMYLRWTGVSFIPAGTHAYTHCIDIQQKPTLDIPDAASESDRTRFEHELLALFPTWSVTRGPDGLYKSESVAELFVKFKQEGKIVS